MKKLMIAAAIVCAAALSQAATTTWSFLPQDTIMDASGSSAYSGDMTVYVFTKGAAFDKDAALDSWNATASAGTFYLEDVVSTKLAEETTYSFYLYANTGSAEYIGTATNKKSLSVGTQETALKLGEWSSVPEPTSGLLLILGVAGLALRRRRA